MKSIQSLFSIISIAALTACSSTPPQTTTTPTEVTVQTPAPEPAKTTVVVQPAKENNNSTEIGIDKNGVSYTKKTGDKVTDVKMTTEEKSVTIKK